jgi:hypothetical protein
VTAPRLLTALLDRRLIAWSAVWAAVSLLAFGLVTAIIPNPVFGRQIPPEPFAIWTWLASAPLMGLVMATYTVPVAPSRARTRDPIATVALGPPPSDVAERRSTTLGGLAGFGAFLAIGCPVCNKVALVLLGASGAMSVYAPIQPVIAVVSLALLVATAAFRLRMRAAGGACPA